MDDDDEWQLSAEQLDALERDAKVQLAQMQRSPSSAMALSLPSSSSSVSLSSLPQSSPRTNSLRPFSSNSLPASQARSIHSPLEPPSCASDSLQSSPLKRCQSFSPLRPSDSPGNTMPSPRKCSEQSVPFKIFPDRHGFFAVETYYNQQIVAAFKNIRGHEWDTKRRIWIFPESHFEDILEIACSCLPMHMKINVGPSLLVPPDFMKAHKNLVYATSPTNFTKTTLNELSTSQSEDNNMEDTIISPNPRRSLFLVVQVFLKDNDHVATRSPYHENIKRACQSVPGRSWNVVEKIWTFPKSSLEDLVQALANISSPEVKVELVPPLVISTPTLHQLVDCAKPMESSGNVVVDSQMLLDSFPRTHGNGLCDCCVSNMPCDLDKDVVVKKHTVKLMLHTSGKIAARCEYDPHVVSAMRSVLGAEWQPKERLWMFPLSRLSELEHALSSFSNVQVEQLEALVRRALNDLKGLPNFEGKYEAIPLFLEAQLLPFQRTGVRFALSHGGRALIADEMGLGKTLQAISITTCFQEDWPVLVIVPSALRLHWAIMLKKWLNIRPMDITVVMSQGGGSNRDGFNVVFSTRKTHLKLDGLYNIVSYDIVPKLQNELADSDFKVVIADESHYMKNAQAKRTAACVPLIQKAKYAVLLTGTPALSRPMELFKQLQALKPSIYKDVHEYGKRYCTGGIFGMYQGASNHEELHALIKSTIMIRRLKREVLSELPQKRRQQVFLSLDTEGTKQMRALFLELEDIKRRISSCTESEIAEKLKYAEKQLISKIYTESGKVKLPAVQEYLTTILEADCKFLIFAHHQYMLNGIQSLLVKKKINYIRIDGSTPALSRQTMAMQFQDDQQIQVALLGIRAAGVGLTLTAASTVVFAEMSWTPGDLVQAEDRAHRIGQRSSVNVHYLHANDTIDDLIWDSIQNKLENLGQVLDGKEEKLHASAASLHPQAISQRQGTLDTFVGKTYSNSRRDSFQVKESEVSCPAQSLKRFGDDDAINKEEILTTQSKVNISQAASSQGHQSELNTPAKRFKIN